uniref:Uncharacterized protein n=1 Tax=Meloidogyne enterolobii TaxID=390850 RepID=A0A6V7TNN8_MELEN|nr:unnamed protein product [Meloidogyne enterolobii]
MSGILLFLCFFLASFPSFLFLFFPSSSVSVKSYSLRPTEKKHPFVRVIYLLLISNDFVTCLRKVSFFCVMNALKPMSEKKIFFGGKDMYTHFCINLLKTYYNFFSRSFSLLYTTFFSSYALLFFAFTLPKSLLDFCVFCLFLHFSRIFLFFSMA